MVVSERLKVWFTTSASSTSHQSVDGSVGPRLFQGVLRSSCGTLARVLLALVGALLLFALGSVHAQPKPTDLTGLPKSGRIDAKTGQLIEGLEISNPAGPCIVVPQGATNVTIRRSRIGPCGPAGMSDYGVFIQEGASKITISGNVIHDTGSGIKAVKAISPLIIDRNVFYNIRGPLYNGQAVQLARIRPGDGQTKITCNVSDARYGDGPKSYEDHISLYDDHGSRDAPIEVAYNRVRGGTSKSGGGITVGDKGGSWIHVHDNIVVKVANSGIGVAGGHNILVENNRVDNRGDDLSSQTHVAYFVRALSECRDITLRGNRGTARLWNWKEERGELIPGYRREGRQRCANVVDDDNQFGDTSLSEQMFDEQPTECR